MQDRTIAGKYKLTRELGRGAMGVVWEAFDETLQRPVAVKLIKDDGHLSGWQERLLQREAISIAKLKNKHIVQVYDYGIHESSPYLVMELLEGETLADKLAREGELTPAATLSLIQQIGTGLEAANTVGIVHRDLKPANIFLAHGEIADSVKILDFGVVWNLGDDENSLARRRAGTPSYMSPEQVRNEVPSHSSDLWALSVIAYRALTGELPFASTSLGELFVQICVDPHEPPESIVKGLPPGTDAFFERALAKEQSHRFQTAREFCTAFAALLRGGKELIHILVVDDEPDLELMMKLNFRQKIRAGDYKFLFAGDGQSALDKLQKHPDIDVILSDINMPSMDGLTFLQRVPEVSPHSSVVMVSAFGDMSNIRGAMNRGAFDFVLKPIDFADLEATIEKTGRHVRELRKTSKAQEENLLLRSLVNSTLLERMRALGPGVAMAAEGVEATIVALRLFESEKQFKGKSPAEIARILNANFEVIVPLFSSREGVVNKILGDSILFVFQGPTHTERALEAMLAVRGQMSYLLQAAGSESPYASGVCAGISAGRVIAGVVGSRGCGRVDYAVFGNAVDKARSLAAAAQPGHILVDAVLRISMGVDFEFEEFSPSSNALNGGYSLNWGLVRRRRHDALRVTLGEAPTEPYAASPK